MAVCGSCDARDGERIRSRELSRTGLARVCGDLRLSGGWVGRRRCRQAGSGMARSRAKARLNFSAQGQRSGRCRVNRRAERVSRPAREKNRRRRVLVVAIRGGEGVAGAMIRARTWVAGRLGGGLQALLGAPMAAYSGCGERDGGIGHGKRRSRTGLARVCGDVGLAGGSVADGRRQAGSGMARSRARARLNCSSQGQRRGRCRVNRRAERVIRPAKAKTRRLRVLVVTIC